ncbi:hypothetical protein FXB39_07870 [Nocardioides sp. BGMRC 2183]|nr:hypothetical protein FXB39_07870 [Nocardioides sp. BGMRC 2183]
MVSRYDRQTLLRRRLIVGVTFGLIVLVTIGAWIFLVPAPAPPQGRPAGPAPAPSGPDAQTDTTNNADVPSAEELPRLAKISDPEAFARAAAEALFAWDTTAPAPLSAYSGRLVAAADPTGESAPGLVADVATYLPTEEAWAMLRSYATRQWLEVTSAEVPTQWAQALAEAGPEGLAPGTTAYTIRGTRHRAGVWEGTAVTTEDPVAFTVFIVCGPTYPECHLLRLSRLDDPLE